MSGGLDFLIKPEWRLMAALTADDKEFLSEAGIAVDENTPEESNQQ